jgi:hypothetical protein
MNRVENKSAKAYAPVRIKKKCGKCEYLCGFPYVHCRLGASITNDMVSPITLVSHPSDPVDCRDKRENQFLYGGN